MNRTPNLLEHITLKVLYVLRGAAYKLHFGRYERGTVRRYAADAKMFLFSRAFRPSLGHTWWSYSKGSGASAQVKWPECKVDHSSPSSVYAEKSYNYRLRCDFMAHTGTNLLLCKGYQHRFVTLKPPSSGNFSDYELIVALSKYGKVPVRQSASGFTPNRG
jgi:hypothetical protein